MSSSFASSIQPTDEQVEALRLFKTGRRLKITAFAGAGKTTTLRMLAESRRERGLYLAFNKAIASDATEKFPRAVDCRTSHSLAFRQVKSSRGFSPEKMTGSLQAKQLQQMSRFADIVISPHTRVTGIHQAHLVLGTVKHFCQSDAVSLGLEHVPKSKVLARLPGRDLEAIRNRTLSIAVNLWARMVDPGDDTALGHDGYLKLWALGAPRIAAHYILLDEAQDSNPALLGVLARQDAQVVYVGDSHQQIYEWRGAVDAMTKIREASESTLSKSFRFGDAIAKAASRVLATLGETRSITGNEKVASVIGSGPVNAILSRTNAGVIAEVLRALEANQAPHVVGGTAEFIRLLEDVAALKAGVPAACPDFLGFTRWRDVVEFSETEEGEEHRTFVKLVEQYGEQKLLAAMRRVQSSEEEADIVVSTAHKAKGREWDAVRLTDDFISSRPSKLGKVKEEHDAEVRLFYVAMTRAKRLLDVSPHVLDAFTAAKGEKPAQLPPSPQPTERASVAVPPAIPYPRGFSGETLAVGEPKLSETPRVSPAPQPPLTPPVIPPPVKPRPEPPNKDPAPPQSHAHNGATAGGAKPATASGGVVAVAVVLAVWALLAILRGNENVSTRSRRYVPELDESATPVDFGPRAATWGESALRYELPLADSENRTVQRLLTELGYAPGAIDGDIGLRTSAAIKRFQEDAGLKVDGGADRALLEALQAKAGQGKRQ